MMMMVGDSGGCDSTILMVPNESVMLLVMMMMIMVMIHSSLS